MHDCRIELDNLHDRKTFFKLPRVIKHLVTSKSMLDLCLRTSAGSRSRQHNASSLSLPLQRLLDPSDSMSQCFYVNIDHN